MNVYAEVDPMLDVDAVPWPPAVGSPAWLYLNEYARLVRIAFDGYVYLVGSATTSRTWRDVDVTVVIPDDRFREEYGEPIGGVPTGTRWSVMCMAFSELGHRMTGLPIDFKVRSFSQGDEEFGTNRVPLGLEAA